MVSVADKIKTQEVKNAFREPGVGLYSALRPITSTINVLSTNLQLNTLSVVVIINAQLTGPSHPSW